MPTMKSTDNLAPLYPIYCSMMKASYPSYEDNADLCFVGKYTPTLHVPIPNQITCNCPAGNGRFAK